jgi:hypothetical protein
LEQLIPESIMVLETAKKQIKNASTFDKLLDLTFNEISLDHSSNYKTISLKHCTLNPSSCNDHLDKQYSNLNELRNKIDNNNKKLCHYNDVINQLKNLNNFNTNNENIYFDIRFYENDMACVYFDKSQFDEYEDEYVYMHSMDLFLSFGKTHHNERSFIYFEYKKEKGSLWIIDMFSVVKKKGHARFMLETMENLIPFFNNRIEKINKNIFTEIKEIEKIESWEEFVKSRHFSKPISYIHGNIVPGAGITDAELRVFYKKVGFLNDARLYRKVGEDV